MQTDSRPGEPPNWLGSRWSRRLAGASIQHPQRVLWVAMALTALAASGVVRLELRTDGRALAPSAAPEVTLDREIRERFDLRDVVAVVIRAGEPDGIFDPFHLRRVQEVTEALAELSGVRPFDLASLATEQGFRHRKGTLRFRTLLEEFPESSQQLELLRSDLGRIGLYEGTLVSRDGSAASVLVGVPPDSDRRRLIRRIGELLELPATEQTDSRASWAVVGAPVAEALLGDHILADLGIPERLLGGSLDDLVSSRDSPRSRFRRLLPGMVPIAIAVMGLVFLIAFRRPAAALLPLVEIGCCLAIVFGLMGWLGVPVYLTTAVMPVILTAIGAADEIHIFRRYLDLVRGRAGPDQHRLAVATALDEMAPPVTATSITTAAAFLCFASSPIAAVRAFGVFTALGVIVCLLFSLSVIPAMLVVLGARPWSRRRDGRHEEDSLRRSGFGVIAAWSTRRRFGVLLGVVLLALVALDGVRRLRVQDSWIDGFAPNSSFAIATRSFDERFLGSHLLQLVAEIAAPALEGEVAEEKLEPLALRLAAPELAAESLAGSWLKVFRAPGGSAGERSPAEQAREWTTWIDEVRREGKELVLTMAPTGGSPRFWLRPRPGERIGYEIRSRPFQVPSNLQRMGELESFLSAQPAVGGVLGPARYLETIGFMTAPDTPGSRSLPRTVREARDRWSNYGTIRGKARLRRLVNPTYGSALVTVFVGDANYRDTGRLIAEIRRFETEVLAAAGIRLSLAGDLAVSQTMIDAVVSTQLRSLLFSLAAIFVCATAISRSLRDGLLTLVPPLLAVSFAFAFMGWLAIPLGVATSMFAGMTLGIGVDFAIHFLARLRLSSAGSTLVERVRGAATITGPAILIDALAVGLGFGTLVLSQVPANARLGGLLTLSVLGCLVATLIVVPALIRKTAPVVSSPG